MAKNINSEKKIENETIIEIDHSDEYYNSIVKLINYIDTLSLTNTINTKLIKNIRKLVELAECETFKQGYILGTEKGKFSTAGGDICVAYIDEPDGLLN